MYTKLTDTIDFKYSIICIDCVYSDLGYNGTKDCVPKSKSCVPLNSYDLSMKSRLRKEDIFCPEGTSQQQNSKGITNLATLQRKD